MPDMGAMVDDNRLPTLPWVQFFSRVLRIVRTGQESGTTALRPTSGVWVGRFYFDTTLNKPIWVKTVSPLVWIDATGAVV